MATIDTLPDELVSAIFKYVPIQDETTHAWLCKWRLSLMLVCKRWQRLFEPQLYHCLMFYYGEPRLKIQDMTRLLRERPHLCKYVRHVYLGKGPNEFDQEAYGEFFNLVLPIASLEILEYSEAGIPVLHKIAEARCLQYLRAVGFPLWSVLKYFGTTNLQSLRLRHASWRTNLFSSTTFSTLDADGSTSSDMYAQLPHLTEGTGTLKKLRLNRCSAYPDELATFLRWPAALATFKFRKPSRRFTQSDMQALLDLHKPSLKHITLSRLSADNAAIELARSAIYDRDRWAQSERTIQLNFTNFFNLIHLNVHAHNDIINQSPTHLASVLAAPQLRHLTIDFDPQDGLGATFQIFSPVAVTWLHDLVASLLTQQCESRATHGFTPPTSVFYSFHLDYRPWRRPIWRRTGVNDDAGFISSIDDDQTYPWNYLDEARTLLAAQGVKLTWPMTDVTREEWLADVEKVLDRHRETESVAATDGSAVTAALDQDIWTVTPRASATVEAETSTRDNLATISTEAVSMTPQVEDDNGPEASPQQEQS